MRARTGVTALGLSLSLVLISCGSDDSTSPPAESGPVHTEAAKSVTKNIGPSGGSISTTASNGTEYTLEVPEGALIKGTKITMTPVSSIEDLGLSGGLAGGVVLSPSGLVFAEAAVLHIVTTKSADAGEQLAAFSSNGDFSQRSLSIAATDGDEIDVLVSHFSAVGAGFGSTIDLASFFTMGSNVIENLISQVNALATPWDDAARAQAAQKGHDAFAQVVLPRLQNAANDTDVLDALEAYDRWRYLLALIDANGSITLANLNGGATVLSIPSGFAAEVDQALAAAKLDLALAISGNNQVCKAQQSLTALANVLYWQTQARLLGIDTVANQLDRQTVLSGLCADVVLQSGSLPEDLQVGFPHSLDLDFGLQFEGSSAIKNAPFFVEITGSNLDIQHPSGFTDAAGKYTTVVTATQDGGVSFVAKASLVLPGTQVASDVIGFGGGGAGSIDVTGRWGGQADGIFEGDSELRTNFEVHLTQNQNAITGTLSGCAQIGPGTITATLSGVQLLNVALVIGDGSDTCVLTGVGSVNPEPTRGSLNAAGCPGSCLTLSLGDPTCDGGILFNAFLVKDVDACH